MKIIKLMPATMRVKCMDVSVDSISREIDGSPMLVYEGKRFAMLCSAEAKAAGIRKNEAATLLTGEDIYGLAVIIGLKGRKEKTWCDVSIETIVRVRGVYREIRNTRRTIP